MYGIWDALGTAPRRHVAPHANMVAVWRAWKNLGESDLATRPIARSEPVHEISEDS